MTEHRSDVSLVKVTREKLLSFLKSAQKQVLIAKPGYFKDEIAVLVELAKEQSVECRVYIDPDETTIRHGFGDVDALKTAKEHLPLLNLQTIEGIRLSVVIVDDRALLFAPAALSWEEEPTELTYPNGLEGGQTLVNQLLLQFKLSNSEATLPKNVSVFPTVTIKDIEKAAAEENLTRTIESLDKNPPVNPSALRQVNIYRNLYKIVKFQIRGVQVKNKTLDLAPFNKLLPESNRHLKRSWQVFTPEDVEKISEFAQFRKGILDLVMKSTAEMGRHGYLIPLDKKKTLEDAIEKSKTDFLASLKAKDGPQNALRGILDQSRTGLVDYLFQEVREIGQIPEALFVNNRIYLKRLKDGEYSVAEKDAMVREVLADFVDDKLHFPEASEVIDSIDVTLDYYDVSDELLRDQEFKDRLSEAGVSPRKYGQGYEQEAPGQSDLFPHRKW